MNRRAFLQTSGAWLSGPLGARAAHAARPESPRAMTVRGPIEPAAMGVTLPHEHVLVDFAGAAIAAKRRYDPDEVFEVVKPHLEHIRDLGCQTFCECTPAYLGRDPELLARLAEATGLRILTNTGYYNANGGQHLPEHARRESAEALADRWTAEWEDGIDGTGIRPGFIKIGVDRGPLPETSRKLVRAAALTHKRTGLTIAAHTGDGAAALEELDLLKNENVDPSAFIWVHAQNERDRSIHEQVAARGAWVEFDGLGPNRVDRHLELVRAMKEAGRLDRVLLSHDAGWYRVGEPGGGRYRPHDTLFEAFLPALSEAGFTERERRRLIVTNPAEAFAIRVRQTS